MPRSVPKPKGRSAGPASRPRAATGRVEQPARAVDAPTARSLGRAWLLGSGETLEQVAARVGATKQAVSLWRSGKRVPDELARRRLERAYGVPAVAWDTAGTEDGPVSPASACPEPAPFDLDGPEPSALDDCVNLLRMLRRRLNRSDLLARERVQLAEQYARALAQKERLERDRAMLEVRIIREHPGWRRLRDLIGDALLEHPDAARAVATVIRRTLGEEQP